MNRCCTYFVWFLASTLAISFLTASCSNRDLSLLDDESLADEERERLRRLQAARIVNNGLVPPRVEEKADLEVSLAVIMDCREEIRTVHASCSDWLGGPATNCRLAACWTLESICVAHTLMDIATPGPRRVIDSIATSTKKAAIRDVSSSGVIAAVVVLASRRVSAHLCDDNSPARRAELGLGLGASHVFLDVGAHVIRRPKLREHRG